jgi:integral membrane protein
MIDATRTTAEGLTPKRLYCFLAIAETITWTLLIIGMVAKYGFRFDALAFPFGLTHGTVFVAYGATQILVGLNQRWTAGRILLGIVTAIVPYATIPWERSLERKRALDGPWRRQPSDDPRDASPIDRLFRWAITHPILLAVLVGAAVAAVVTVLLQLGPPTGWFD